MWSNPQFAADFVTFTEEILNVKLHFLCNDAEEQYRSKIISISSSSLFKEIILNWHLVKTKFCAIQVEFQDYHIYRFVLSVDEIVHLYLSDKH